MTLQDASIATEPPACPVTAVLTATLHVNTATGERATIVTYVSSPSHLTIHQTQGTLLLLERRVVRADVICETNSRGRWAPVNGPFLQIEARRSAAQRGEQNLFISSGPLAKAFVQAVVHDLVIAWLASRDDVRTVVAHRTAAGAVERQRAALAAAERQYRREEDRLETAEAEYFRIVGRHAPARVAQPRHPALAAQRGIRAAGSNPHQLVIL
jgi:hypothetical protein